MGGNPFSDVQTFRSRRNTVSLPRDTWGNDDESKQAEIKTGLKEDIEVGGFEFSVSKVRSREIRREMPASRLFKALLALAAVSACHAFAPGAAKFVMPSSAMRPLASASSSPRTLARSMQTLKRGTAAIRTLRHSSIALKTASSSSVRFPCCLTVACANLQADAAFWSAGRSG